MDIRSALKEQNHAALAMLADCVDRCPDDIWTSGTHPRTFWRIAFHAAFFAQLYLGQNRAAFQPWPSAPERFAALWSSQHEPYDLSETIEAPQRKDALEYIAFVDSLIDPTIDSLNLDTGDAGFAWYKDINKLSHEIMSLRHIQGHVGQLSELLMAHGIDTDWIAKRTSAIR